MSLHDAPHPLFHTLPRYIARGIVLLLGIAIVWFVLRLSFAPTAATADSSTLYPHVCLGGWIGAGYASLEPSVAEGADASAYTKANSAYLAADMVAPIFCSGFEPTATDLAPHQVRVTFDWVAEQEKAPAPSGLEGTSVEPPAAGEDVIEVPALGTPETTKEVSPLHEDAPAQEPAASEPAAMREFLLSLIAERAYAETGNDSQFLVVSYSLDGNEWHELGRIAKDAVTRFSATVPVSSWDDIRALQLRVEVLPSTGHPAVLLDSVALSIEYDTTIGDALSGQVAAVADAAAGAMDFINDLADSALALLSGEEAPASEQPAVQAAPVETAPVVRTEQRLTFAKNGVPLSAHRVLPWYTEEMKKIAAARTGALPVPQISIADEGLTMRVSGTCARAYFVVLTFRNADDYLERPQTFASNYADRCAGGTFEYDMRMLPLDTPDGQYYLMLAEQNDQEAWVPASALVPIEIGHREVEISE